MKITAAVAMAVAAGCLGQAAASEADRTVVVYLANEHAAMENVLFAKDRAAKMFARIGVQIEWHSLGHGPLPPNALVVEMVEQASENECVGALACAKPYEGVRIRVFCDRFRTMVPESMTRYLLAHVLVHEITHILQGVNRHSESGIMKARWDADDFVQMKRKTLPFSSQDVLLIERGLAARQSRLAIAASRPESSVGTL